MSHGQTLIGSGAHARLTFCGPFGVGKTTAVQSLCGAVMVNTEAVRAIVPVGHTGVLGTTKTDTTVGFDYGEWLSPDGRQVKVFGTPGQSRFGEMRSMICRRDTAVVLWLNGEAGSDALDAAAARWLAELKELGLHNDLVVAVTRVAPADAEKVLDRLQASLSAEPMVTRCVCADPRDAGQVAQVAEFALELLSSRGKA